jgi:hypothetical protein
MDFPWLFLGHDALLTIRAASVGEIAKVTRLS